MLEGLILTSATVAEGAAHAAGEGAAHAEPHFIFGAGGWVALAMILLIAIMLWKKVPALIGRMLDGRIAAIRAQLDEASALRRDAETLRTEYETKLAALTGEAQQMRARAGEDAAQILAKAEADATVLIARRQQMAEDRIAAAERAAIADVRATASRAAVSAARDLIRAGHDTSADRPLIDRAIADIGRL